MPMIHITIEKVIVRQDDELLLEIRDLLKDLVDNPHIIESIEKLKTARQSLKDKVDKATPPK